MQLYSREVITLRLIVDCDCDNDLVVQPVLVQPPTLANLPTEIRLQILRFLLRFDWNSKPYTRRVPEGAIDRLLRIDSRQILEAPHFKHRSTQELNGILPVRYIVKISPAVLRVCKQLFEDGKAILYEENKVIGVQSGLKLASRFDSYGISTWGPFPASKLDFTIKGKSGKITRKVDGNRNGQGHFNPIMLLRGQHATTSTPFYICSRRDGPDLLHALWILIMAPFARSMKFNVYLPRCKKYQLQKSTNSLTQLCAFPWLHNYLGSVIVEECRQKTPPSRVDFQSSLSKHKANSIKEPYVYTYYTICGYLEVFMSSADRAIEVGHYTKAETLYERVLFEASSLVRTRTAQLVYVSNKTKDGINRVCKLIAISAYRLCELRSGAIVAFKSYGKTTATAASPPTPDANTSPVVSFFDAQAKEKEYKADISAPSGQQRGLPSTDRLASDTIISFCQSDIAKHLRGPQHSGSTVQTTRLDPPEALPHALLSGLLALRLPCVTSIPEWNVRLNLMLWYTFNRLGQDENCYHCILQLSISCDKLLEEAQTRKKQGKKWDELRSLAADLVRLLPVVQKQMISSKKKTESVRAENQDLIQRTQRVVRQLWGERLAVKKGYTGLIWTFRWA